jgi:YqaJ-like viral recombinase domain
MGRQPPSLFRETPDDVGASKINPFGFDYNDICSAHSEGVDAVLPDAETRTRTTDENATTARDDAFDAEGKSDKVEDAEEEHGSYENDESDAPLMRKRSFLYRLKPEDHQRFLSQAPLTRGDALRNMNPIEKMIFEFLIVLTPLILLANIWQLPQKSGPWLWARTGRLTGSHTATAVGHQRGVPIMRGPYQSMYTKFKGNKASRHGSGKEVFGTQCYVNDFKRLVTQTFREQRRSGTIQADGNGYFVFRNQQIPVPDINEDPLVEVRHFGLIIDPLNHFRGTSPDGVVFINGVAVGALEVKCPYASGSFSIYPNILDYYFDQIQSELYVCHLYWPTIHWVDFVVWSPKHFTVDTFTFDAKYYFHWYAPRELKYYFRLYLKGLGEKMYLTAQQENNELPPNDQLIRQVIERECTMPPPPPPMPPPSPKHILVNEPTDEPPGLSGAGSYGESGSRLDPEWEKQLLDLDLDFSDSVASSEKLKENRPSN